MAAYYLKSYTYDWGSDWGCDSYTIKPDDIDIHNFKENNKFIPKQIIVNNKTVVCIWKDGSKTKVTCSDDDVFTVEAGVAHAIAKKIFGSRSAFLRAVEKAYVQLPKNLNKSNG